jgi:glycosyltransferase involved in cell wall biosynthesis
MAQARQMNASFDLLILPSQFDGWGAVVNEALMCGVPVICSDQCGAADLLAESWRGSIFRNASVGSLTQELRAWIKHGPISASERQRIQQWSHCIEGESVAHYLIDILRHVYEGSARPTAPWRIVKDDSPG